MICLIYQVRLLKDVLEAWRREVEKKAPSMTVSEAYAALGLAAGAHDEAAVRKAYYRLAHQYHPDKNPEGRVSAIVKLALDQHPPEK